MSSVASSVKIAATSGSKSPASSEDSGSSSGIDSSDARFVDGGFLRSACRSSGRYALIERLVGFGNTVLQFPMGHEIPRGFVEMSCDGFHREHAVRQQTQVLLCQTQPAAEHAPQPVIERLGNAGAVARLRHLRATREGMARAIDVLGENMGLRHPRLAFEIRPNGSDVGVCFARIDLAQYVVET